MRVRHENVGPTLGMRRPFIRLILEISEKLEPMPLNTADLAPQPTVACPKCGTQVPLTEALAAPLLEATRAE